MNSCFHCRTSACGLLLHFALPGSVHTPSRPRDNSLLLAHTTYLRPSHAGGEAQRRRMERRFSNSLVVVPPLWKHEAASFLARGRDTCGHLRRMFLDPRKDLSFAVPLSPFHAVSLAVSLDVPLTVPFAVPFAHENYTPAGNLESRVQKPVQEPRTVQTKNTWLTISRW